MPASRLDKERGEDGHALWAQLRTGVCARYERRMGCILILKGYETKRKLHHE